MSQQPLVMGTMLPLRHWAPERLETTLSLEEEEAVEGVSFGQDFSSVSCAATGLLPTQILVALPPAPRLWQLSSHSGTLCLLFDMLPLLLPSLRLPSHLPAALGFKCLRDSLPWIPLSPSVIGI